MFISYLLSFFSSLNAAIPFKHFEICNSPCRPHLLIILLIM